MSLSVREERRFEPVLVYSATRGRSTVRWTLVVVLALAPLAIGCRHPAAYIPLLAVSFAVGAYSLYREHTLRKAGVPMPSLPGETALLALLALVTFQLVPLPPAILSIVSPGSFAFYNDPLLVPLRAWKPITASPADTARGLAFLAGMSLLYRAAFRELDQSVWRRRLITAVVAAGFVMTIEALIQQAYSERVIYGVWRPRWDWAVFGPYINKNLFAGYMLMAVPLGIGFCAEALDKLRHAWGRRRRRAWLAIGDPEGNTFVRRAAVAMVLVVGLLATGSRGGLLGFVAAGIATTFVARRRRVMLAVAVMIAALGLAWIGLAEHRQGFASRGLQGRLEVWRDAAPMIPQHLLFGAGFNAFGTAYAPRQHVWTMNWIGAAHNEYLQIVIDLGLAGLVPAAVLIVVLMRRARESARQDAVHAGLFGSLAAVLAHNVVDYNWQLAANAATFAVLAGLAVQPSPPHHLDPPRRHA